MEKGAPIGVLVLPSLQGIGPPQPSVDRLALLHPTHQLFNHQLQQQRQQTYSPKALVSIAHIRKDCHPFSRRWGAQTWVFAHNGDLQGAIPLGDCYRPFGSTDSEAAFCWILEQLDQARVDPADSSALFEQLHHCAAQLAERGTFNALITTDEHWQPFQAGESLLLQAGEVIQRSRHGVRPDPISASSQPAATAQTSAR